MIRLVKFQARFILAGLFLLPAACKDSEQKAVRHREMSEEETNRAIEKAYVQSEGKEATAAPGDITQLFEELSLATRSEDPLDPDRFFSIEAMISALKSTDSLKNVSPKFMKGMEKGFEKAKGKLAASLQQMGYDNFKILMVDNLPGRSKLVYTRLYDNEYGIVQQIRWWIVETDEGWKIYDYEDLSMGLRTISLMGNMMAAVATGKTPQWILDFVPLSEGLQLMDYSDPESVTSLEPLLTKLRSNKLPQDILSFASMMMISVHTTKEDYPEALKELDAAKAGDYTSPLHDYQKGIALMGLEKYEKALSHFEKHMTRFGRDSDTLELVSDCHLCLEQNEQARTAATGGLEDNPASVNCLAALVAATPVDQLAKDAVISFFDAMPDPEVAYEISLDYLIDLEKDKEAAALFAVFQKKHPESELLEYYLDYFAEEN